MTSEGLTELTAAIRTHPRFPEAAQQYVVDFIAWRERLGVLNKIVSSLSRERIIDHMLYLHFSRDMGEGHKGATFERLAALSDMRDEIGARAVRTVLRLSQIAGLIVLTRSPSDGRLRIYQPTPLLLDIDRDAYADALSVLDVLRPGGGLAKRLRTEAGFLPDLLAKVGAAYLASGLKRGRQADALTTLLQFDGARPILATAIDRHGRGLDLPTAQEFSRRFYVSPSQTRVILKAAESLGLIATAGRGRLTSVEPLASVYFDALAAFLAFVASSGLGWRDITA